MSQHRTPAARPAAASALPRERAVVIGASIAGLLATAVLADHFDEVVIIERDRLPDGPERRRGVPQGRHLHALLGRGGQILRELFPGIEEDFWAAGAQPAAGNEEIRFITEHGVLPRIPITESLVCSSRPLLEHVVRRRVLALTNVRLQHSTEVTAPSTDESGRVTGVRLYARDLGTERRLTADLVVDASGRGGRAAAWLEAIGEQRPREDTIRTDLRYVTARLPMPRSVGGDRLILVSPRPALPMGLAAAVVEKGDWLVTMFGYGRYQPSTRPEDFLGEAAKIAPPDLLAALRTAGPPSEVLHHQLPTSLWRRYDLLGSFPRGLLVFGDAICSFNPIYGQGMTVAAQEALVLREWLASGSDDPRRFLRAARKVIQVAWEVVRGGDLSLPEVPGPRPPAVRLMSAYLQRLQATAVDDHSVAEAYLRVVAMLDQPAGLLRPAVSLRVLRHALRGPGDRLERPAPVSVVPAGPGPHHR